MNTVPAVLRVDLRAARYQGSTSTRRPPTKRRSARTQCALKDVSVRLAPSRDVRILVVLSGAQPSCSKVGGHGSRDL